MGFPVVWEVSAIEVFINLFSWNMNNHNIAFHPIYLFSCITNKMLLHIDMIKYFKYLLD